MKAPPSLNVGLVQILIVSFFFALCTSQQCTPISGLVDNPTSGDNLNAIQSALSNLAVGGCLLFPQGKFRISDNINVEKYNVTVRGAGSDKTVLLMVNPSTAGWRVFSDNHTLTGLSIKVIGASGRGDQNQQGMSTLLLDGTVNRGNGLGCFGFYGYDLILDGAKATAFFAYNASSYTLRRVYANNSLADSFHNTAGSRYGTFIDCRSRNGGDDMMAFVHYDGSDSPSQVSHHMNVIRFQGFGNTLGRGLANVNCHDIYVEDIYSEGTSAAGIIIARENAGSTTAKTSYSTKIVKSSQGGNRLVGCNYGAEDHASVFYTNPDTTNEIYDITIEDVDIVDSNLGRSAGFSSGSVFVIDTGIVKTVMNRFIFYGSQPSNRFARGSNPNAGSIITRTGWDETKVGTKPNSYVYTLERNGFVNIPPTSTSSTSESQTSEGQSSNQTQDSSPNTSVSSQSNTKPIVSSQAGTIIPLIFAILAISFML